MNQSEMRSIVSKAWTDEGSDIQRFVSGPNASTRVYSKVLSPTSALVWTKSPTSKKRQSSGIQVHPARRTSRADRRRSGDRKTSNSTSKRKQQWLLRGLALLACICLMWTIWLILLTTAPNETINRVMRTQNFDNGTFWLMIDTPPTLLWPTVIGLAVVGLGYAVTIIQLIGRRNRFSRVSSVSRSFPSIDAYKTRVEMAVVNIATNHSPTTNRVMTSAAKLVVFFTRGETSTRKLMSISLKFVDLVIEAVLLFQLLEAGTPLVLVIIFTLIVSANALSCVALMFLPYECTVFTEMLVDVLFDFLVAVGYPILVLVYCLSTFHFDRERLAINLEVFFPESLEQEASVMADPVQTDVIHNSIKQLRVDSALKFFTLVGVNLMFCFRLYRVSKRAQDSSHLCVMTYPRHHRALGVLLVAFLVLVIVFVQESVRTASTACQPYPECVVNAHRWTILKSGSLSQCPCLTLIDGTNAPKTYDEWMHPKDLTDRMAQLATTGDLQTIQLTNRYLPVLPSELRGCTKMKHLALIYTHTSTMPSWVKEFTQLQYLHVEGTTYSSLVSLPADMFDNMKSLNFLYLGIHPPLQQLPSFDGLTSLKSLRLALLFSLVELPSFKSLHNLERLAIISLVNIASLPDLAPVKRLMSFRVADRATWCCNGFLGECDLQSPHCQIHPLWGTPAASCLPANRMDDYPTEATVKVLKKFSDSICGEIILPGMLEGPPTEVGMNQCGGILYRQCELPGYREAMCYNIRLMGIACSPFPNAIEMRRRQIQHGIGDACNPDYEAWLGCKGR